MNWDLILFLVCLIQLSPTSHLWVVLSGIVAVYFTTKRIIYICIQHVCIVHISILVRCFMCLHVCGVIFLDWWGAGEGAEVSRSTATSSAVLLPLQRHGHLVEALHHEGQVLGEFIDRTSDGHHVCNVIYIW